MTDQTGAGNHGGHRFVRPGQVAPDRPAPDACMHCGEPFAAHALRAVLEALDIPHPATVGDGAVRDRILAERLMHTVIFLQGILSDPVTPPEWDLDYLRDKLAEHPAAGYRTWDQAVAELRAAREVCDV
jgi:hypothetical protein